MAKKYVVDEKNKTITYTIGTLKDKEKSEVLEYKDAGYNIVVKQKKKREGLSYTTMKKNAKGKPFEKELLERINKKENYMSVRSWYLEQIK